MGKHTVHFNISLSFYTPSAYNNQTLFVPVPCSISKNLQKIPICVSIYIESVKIFCRYIIKDWDTATNVSRCWDFQTST